MIRVPSQLYNEYRTFIQTQGVKKGTAGLYLKWLRYYLDFCQKYRESPSHKENLTPFLNKLRTKHQTDLQCKQAHHAVTLITIYGATRNAATLPQERLMYRRWMQNRTLNHLLPDRCTALNHSQVLPLCRKNAGQIGQGCSLV